YIIFSDVKSNLTKQFFKIHKEFRNSKYYNFNVLFDTIDLVIKCIQCSIKLDDLILSSFYLSIKNRNIFNEITRFSNVLYRLYHIKQYRKHHYSDIEKQIIKYMIDNYK